MPAPATNGPAARKRPGPGHRDWSSMPRKTLEERFWPKVDKGGPNGCWIWTAGLSRGGYGRIGRGPRAEGMAYAHRVAYELVIGPIPEGMQIDHLCRNKACVNPAHLESVTQRENILRGTAPTAQNARKTHCKHGHEFTPENTYRQPSWPEQRECLTCKRDLHKAERRRKQTHA